MIMNLFMYFKHKPVFVCRVYVCFMLSAKSGAPIFIVGREIKTKIKANITYWGETFSRVDL